MAAPLDRTPPRRIAPVTIWPAGQKPERAMADGSQPPSFDDDSEPATATLARAAYDAALKQLGVLSRLPTRIVAARTERELREIVGETVVDLLCPVARFELFVAE